MELVSLDSPGETEFIATMIPKRKRFREFFLRIAPFPCERRGQGIFIVMNKVK